MPSSSASHLSMNRTLLEVLRNVALNVENSNAGKSLEVSDRLMVDQLLEHEAVGDAIIYGSEEGSMVKRQKLDMAIGQATDLTGMQGTCSSGSAATNMVVASATTTGLQAMQPSQANNTQPPGLWRAAQSEESGSIVQQLLASGSYGGPCMDTGHANATAEPMNAFGTGRIQMSCPTLPRASAARNAPRRGNKHRRLFDGQAGALKDGEPVTYIMHGERLLTGTVVIRDKATSGILCDHCNSVVSCSAFEAHAGHGQRRNPYDGITTAEGLTLRQIAARLPSLPDHYVPPASLTKRSAGKKGMHDALALLADRCRDVLGQLDTLASSCVICYQTDFEKDGFSDRTVIICDQCEREYHVGCLRAAGRCSLEAVPEGEWFCCPACSSIRASMAALVQAGEAPCCGDLDYTWQVLRGKGGSDSAHKALKQVQEVLQESFDPIIDMTTRQDLLPKMVAATSLGEFDFQGMYSILLKHRGKPVCAALLRIFGQHVAELPLVATKAAARRQGHCKVLLAAIESRLQSLGVGVLSLPAAAPAVHTWINSFHFRHMEPQDLQAVQSELRLLMFPGSQILYKVVGPQLLEGPFAFAALPGQAGLQPLPSQAMPGISTDVAAATIMVAAAGTCEGAHEHGQGRQQMTEQVQVASESREMNGGCTQGVPSMTFETHVELRPGVSGETMLEVSAGANGTRVGYGSSCGYASMLLQGDIDYQAAAGQAATEQLEQAASVIQLQDVHTEALLVLQGQELGSSKVSTQQQCQQLSGFLPVQQLAVAVQPQDCQRLLQDVSAAEAFNVTVAAV